MAIPTSKSTFKDYCFRALGSGVIDINVSDDQADDRIDEALQYFAQYHYDGIEKMYLKHLITAVTSCALMICMTYLLLLSFSIRWLWITLTFWNTSLLVKHQSDLTNT